MVDAGKNASTNYMEKDISWKVGSYTAQEIPAIKERKDPPLCSQEPAIGPHP